MSRQEIAEKRKELDALRDKVADLAVRLGRENYKNAEFIKARAREEIAQYELLILERNADIEEIPGQRGVRADELRQYNQLAEQQIAWLKEVVFKADSYSDNMKLYTLVRMGHDKRYADAWAGTYAPEVLEPKAKKRKKGA